MLASARFAVYFGGVGVGTVFYGWLSVKLRSIREALTSGFLVGLAGVIGMATIQPGQNANPMIFAALGGIGTASVLSLAIAGVQLASPHAHLATATAVAVIARAISSTSFTSIYSAVVTQKLDVYIPSYVTRSVALAGLPESSISAFIQALTANNSEQLAKVPGVSQSIIQAGVHALQQAYADGIRYTYIIAAPFLLLAAISAWFLGDLKSIMNYHVDAPVEKLNAKGGEDKLAISA